MGSHTTAGIRIAGDGRRVLDEIRRLVRFLRVSSRDAERGLGISGAQLFVLQTLHAATGPLSVNALAERTLTHQSSVSVVVGKLAGRKLVRREKSEADARQRQVTLLPAANKILRRSPDSAQARLIAALDSLPERDVHKLAMLMGRLNENLGIAGDVPAMLFEDERERAKRR